MKFSVYNHEERRFDYFDAPGETPPHGWFRRAMPGQLKQPEEIAARLPDGAVPCGSGQLPVGVIATTMPGVGGTDSTKPQSAKETGLGQWSASLPRLRPQGQLQRGQRGNGVRPEGVNDDAWESPNSRGRT